jgi:carboxypeptidase C (cathepsin A)
MYLNGLMLVSAILNFQAYRFEAGNDLPPITFLPTYAATAWYHKRLPDDLQQIPLNDVLDEVEVFAQGEYTLALMRGANLPTAERAKIAEKLARYTGLSLDYIERTDLRINIHRFTKELLRDQGYTVGRLDSRYKGRDRDSAGEFYEYDPSGAAITGAYTATLNDYVRSELNYESDLPYEVIKPNLWQNWSYAEHENRFLDVSDTLRKAMAVNPFLKVHVANGYFDLATPYFATAYTFNHLGLDAEIQDNISMSYYPAGHMMYVHLPSLAELKTELAGFIQDASGGEAPGA